jgi:hypothetical protein
MARPGLVTLAYFIFVLPLAVFLYINTFSDAWILFAGYTGSPLIKHPWLFVACAALPGAGMVAEHRRLMVLWLAVATTVTCLIALDRIQWGRLTAFALCLPGWMALWDRVPQLWRASAKPAGDLNLWVRAGLLAVGAGVISSAAHAIYLLRFAPNLNLNLQQGSYVLARVTAFTSLAGLVALVPFLALCVAVVRRPQGSRVLLFVMGLGLGGAVVLILLNGIRRLDSGHAKVSHFAFATAVAGPVVMFFLNRVARIRNSVGEAFIDFGRRVPSAPRSILIWFYRLTAINSQPSSNWFFRVFSIPNPVLWLSAFIVTHMFIGNAHVYYGWGSVTSLLYGAVAFGLTWYLLTCLPAPTQNALGVAVLMLAVGGSLTLVPRWSNVPLWSSYLKFDRNLGAAVGVYYERHPSSDPELARLRERILASRDEAVGRDLRQWHMQELSPGDPSHPPWVFFIVVDALRYDTYSGSRANRQKFPGLNWLADRFVDYENTWTSYNSTEGSMPAYLNGILHPAWYRITADDHVQHDNLLVRACRLEGYACFNFSGYMPEFQSFWPPESTVPTPQGGIGIGDPGVIFPLALQTADQHRSRGGATPAFFYLHLFNLHQPLFPRPGVPLEPRRLHWLRALYEQNARYFDQQLLTFLKGLAERGLLEQSLVIVTADHGEEFFDLGGLYHGWHINPTVMHVPLFVHYPLGQSNAPAPNTSLRRPVNLIDLAPTICETMGISIRPDSSLQGVSLLSANEPSDRTFPLLNWCSPIVGDLNFSPPRMRVLNCESGAMDVFEPGGVEGWRLQTHWSDPLKCARSLEAELEEMFQFWQGDRSRETTLKLPSP